MNDLAPPASFPGTEPIDDQATTAAAPPEPARKGPSWAERRKAKRADGGEAGTSGSSGGRGGFGWDTRVKVAVVLSFVILVSVLVFNKVKGKPKGATATPLASLSGPKGDADADGAKPDAKGPKSGRDKEPTAAPPDAEHSESPPPNEDGPEKPDDSVPAPMEPAAKDQPNVEGPPLKPDPSPIDKTRSPEPGDEPPLPEPAPRRDEPADAPPPVDLADDKTEANPADVADAPPAIDTGGKKEEPTPSPAPIAVAAAPRSDVPGPKADEAKKPDPASSLPTLATPPSTRDAISLAPLAEVAPGEGVPIPNAGISRTAAASARREAEPIAQAKSVAAPPPSDGPEDGTIHVVRKGENFWTISRYHYASGRFYKALWHANRSVAKAPEDLYVGAVIRIPDLDELNRDLIEAPKVARSEGRAEPTAAQRRDLKAERASAKADPGVALPVANPAKRPLLAKSKPSEPNYKSYVVRGRNETLRSIARDQLGDSGREDEIYRLNRDEFEDDSRKLKPGMALRIPGDTRTR